ncbi:MAG TPA: alpha/beta hydrolase [Gemmatimonadaceae bacterium]|nr:alpha/beta hydrolase [Gemmatimonadaceae bacterium]
MERADTGVGARKCAPCRGISAAASRPLPDSRDGGIDLRRGADRAAWRTKPSWYIVAGNDRMIPPEQERSMAKQMNASTTVVASSHVVMLAHPDAVARVIEDATAGKRK